MSPIQLTEGMTVTALYSIVIGLGVIGIMCVGILTAILLRLKHIDMHFQRVAPLPKKEKEFASRAA